MRILFLNQYALPAGEAGITRHGEIGAELVRRGHEVTVIASEFDYFTRKRTARSRRESATQHDGVRFVWLRTGEYVRNDRRRMASMARYTASATIAGLGVRPSPDVVVASSPHPLTPLAGAAIARLRRVPWVFEARDIWPSALVDLGAIPRNGRTHRLLARVERFSYRSANAVVSVPPRGCTRAEELGLDPAKCMHIPNSATTLRVEPGPLPETLAASITRAKSEGRFVLIYAGAIGVPHSFGTVIDAIRLLRETRPETYRLLEVLIVGDGVAAAETQQAAEAEGLSNFRVHPAVGKRAVRTLLQGADACLMQAANSDHFRYGFSPNKLFDYFAAGKPVLIASTYPTLVDDVNGGVRFAPGDPAALADAITTIVDTSVEEREAMGRRGQEIVAREYSVEAIADRYEPLLADVVTRGRTRSR
jgi:glycosyltransferase involved in cell wall biosynthesis